MERLNGQLVRVSSSRKGGLSLTRLTGGVSGELNVAERKLGSRNLADNVVVFQNDGSGLTAISLSQIADGSVPASQITYAGTDWAGRVKVIVLNSAIGGGYIFGRANYTANYDEEATGRAMPSCLWNTVRARARPPLRPAMWCATATSWASTNRHLWKHPADRQPGLS